MFHTAKINVEGYRCFSDILALFNECVKCCKTFLPTCLPYFDRLSYARGRSFFYFQLRRLISYKSNIGKDTVFIIFDVVRDTPAENKLRLSRVLVTHLLQA
jgi:hypothetical protein